jgi:hypothetical protein
MVRNLKVFALGLMAAVMWRAGASSDSGVVIQQEVSEIRVKPSDSLKTEEGVKQLSQIQKQYRENIVLRTASTSGSRPRTLSQAKKAARANAKKKPTAVLAE